jgi:hypothetical protein
MSVIFFASATKFSKPVGITGKMGGVLEKPNSARMPETARPRHGERDMVAPYQFIRAGVGNVIYS